MGINVNIRIFSEHTIGLLADYREHLELQSYDVNSPVKRCLWGEIYRHFMKQLSEKVMTKDMVGEIL